MSHLGTSRPSAPGTAEPGIKFAVTDLPRLPKAGSYVGLTESARRRSMKVEQLARNFEKPPSPKSDGKASGPPITASPSTDNSAGRLRRAQTATQLKSPSGSGTNLNASMKKGSAFSEQRRPSQELHDTIGNVFASPSASFGKDLPSNRKSVDDAVSARASSSLSETITASKKDKDKKEKKEKKEKKARSRHPLLHEQSASAISVPQEEVDRLKWMVEEQSKLVREQTRQLEAQRIRIEQLHAICKQNGIRLESTGVVSSTAAKPAASAESESDVTTDLSRAGVLRMQKKQSRDDLSLPTALENGRKENFSVDPNALNRAPSEAQLSESARGRLRSRSVVTSTSNAIAQSPPLQSAVVNSPESKPTEAASGSAIKRSPENNSHVVVRSGTSTPPVGSSGSGLVGANAGLRRIFGVFSRDTPSRTSGSFPSGSPLASNVLHSSANSDPASLEAEVAMLRGQVRMLQNLLMVETETNKQLMQGGGVLPSMSSSNVSQAMSASGQSLDPRGSSGGSAIALVPSGSRSSFRKPVASRVSGSDSESSSGIGTTSSSAALGGNRTRARSSVQVQAKPLFGQPLEAIMRGGEIPKPLSRLLSFIEAQAGSNNTAPEQLFCATPNPPVDQGRLEALRVAAESGDLDLQYGDVRTAAALLRVFFLELPVPIITPELDALFQSASQIDSESVRMPVWHLMLQTRVSPFSRHILAALLACVSSLCATHSSAGAVAAELAPVLLGREISQLHEAQRLSEQPPSVKALQRLISDYPIVSAMDPTMSFATDENGLVLVRSAILKRCVDTLLDENYIDDDFVPLMFLTHSYVLPSAQFAELLMARFSTLTNASQRRWEAKLIDRISWLLSEWLANFTPPLQNDELKKSLANFLEMRSAVLPPSTVELIQNFLRGVTKRGSMKKSLTGSGSSTERGGTASPPVGLSVSGKMGISGVTIIFKLSKENPETLAQQLTLFDHDLFTLIPIWEFFNRNLSAPNKSPRFHAMVSKYNEWGRWVASEVVSTPDVTERASLIALVIQTATFCRKYQNFHTSYALFCGLNFSAVSRLRLTWEKLPKKHLEEYKRLEELFNMDNNYKALRAEIKKSQPPLIPYMGLYSKLLTTIEENAPTRLADDHINIEKLRTLSKMGEEILAYQRGSYALFQPQTGYKVHFRNIKSLSEEQIFAKSLQIEPRATSALHAAAN